MPRMPAKTCTQYDAGFYANQRDTSRRSADALLPRVLDLATPKSIVDVGCGLGTWLESARAAGVEDITGLDGGHVDRAALMIPVDHFIAIDLRAPFELPRNFDLAISMEVAEHLPASSADGFVRSLAKLAPIVLFSAAIPFQGGTDHVNEQWPEYWAERFACHGFAPLDVLREAFWSDERVQPCYAQNAIVFVRESFLARRPDLESLMRATVRPLPRLVHPEVYLAHVDPANWTLRGALAELRDGIPRMLRRRLGRGRR